MTEMTEQEALGCLGLKEGASQAEIKKAWRVAVKRIHPDVEMDESTKKQLTVMMYNINEAYRILKRNGTGPSSSGSSSRSSSGSSSRSSSNSQKEQERRKERRKEEGRRNAQKEQEWRKEQENARRARERAIKAEDQVRKGKTILAIIAIISVLFIFNPFSNQTEIIEPVSIIEEPLGVEQPIGKSAGADIPPPVEVIPTIEIFPVESIILIGECDLKGNKWDRESERSERGIDEHSVFFGMYENVCAKAVVVFDLNEFKDLEINSLTLSFSDLLGSYGRTCHGNSEKSFWDAKYSRTCLEPPDSELKYKIQDSLSCTNDVFQESENWQNVNSWINPSDATSTSLDSVAVEEGRYLCLVFSQKGDDVATENYSYFRIWALGNFRIEATYG